MYICVFRILSDEVEKVGPKLNLTHIDMYVINLCAKLSSYFST